MIPADLAAFLADGAVADRIKAHKKRNRCDTPAKAAARKRRQRERGKDDIAVIDFETTPFADEVCKRGVIEPFLCVLHSDAFDTIVIWETDVQAFRSRVMAAIEGLPRSFTIYAHNGGRFDYQFIGHLLRGPVMMKGASLMSFKIGRHQMRDSYHILPVPLKSYKKADFDYSVLTPEKREAHRASIIRYCVSDCVNTLAMVKATLKTNGRTLTVGQAAIRKLRELCPVDRINGTTDAYLRNFYMGGRVEDLFQGPGVVMRDVHLKHYDINSAYPFAMLDEHPVGAEFSFPAKRNAATCFVKLRCRNPHGALMATDRDGARTFGRPEGVFFTTIWEYDVAMKLGLLDRVKVINWVACNRFANFRPFVEKYYALRRECKAEMERLKGEGQEESAEYFEAKNRDTCFKLLLNSSYGKLGQNSRRFTETYRTGIDEQPPGTWLDPELCGGEIIRPEYHKPDDNCEGYHIWKRPSRNWRYYNVATAASITGRVRALLLEAINAAQNPVYCDTDCIIAEDLKNVPMSETELGAWKLEAEYRAIAISAKKGYATRDLKTGRERVKHKGVPTETLSFEKIARLVEHDAEIKVFAKAPTLGLNGQWFNDRTIRRTAKGRSWQFKAA